MDDRNRTLIDELAEELGGGGSPIKGFTHGRILRGVAQNTGRGIRRELAATLNISPATVSKAIDKQATLGLVRQNPLTLTKEFAVIGIAVINYDGRPSKLLGKVAALDGTPFEGFEQAQPRDLKNDPEDNEQGLVQQLVEFANELKSIGEHQGKLLGCGIALSGHVDSEAGVVERAFHTEWGRKRHSLKIRDEIEKELGLPVSLENDVSSLAVRNNLRSLQAQPSKHYGVVALIDRGVGGAIVSEAKTWPGAHGMAGEPGHIPALGTILKDPASPEAALRVPWCQCEERRPDKKPRGHVEAFASPRSIEHRAVDNGLAGEGISLGELAARPRSDERTSMLFYQGGAALGCAVVSLINWFDPANILVYLPTELYETNTWLAGSRYVEGLHEEIRENSFIPSAEKLLEVNPTLDSIMHERLASAAGYLVLRRLIREIQDKRPRRQ